MENKVEFLFSRSLLFGGERDLGLVEFVLVWGVRVGGFVCRS